MVQATGAMRLLPRIDHLGRVWRLPLSDRSLVILHAALLEPSESARPERFANLLAVDASLALWTVCQANLRNGTPLHDPSAAGLWLADHLATFDWSDAAARSAADEGRFPQEQYVEHVLRSVYVAELAAQLARDRGKVDPNQARFAGLLHNANGWFALAAWPSETVRTDPPPLPQWLAEITSADRHAPASVHDLVACVTQAIAMCEAADSDRSGKTPRGLPNAVRQEPPPPEPRSAVASSREGEAPAEPHAGSAWRAAEAYARQWAEPLGELGGLLPTLIARLKRLEALENDLAATVEREKIEAVKNLAYGAGHEINNPLANISARAQALLRDERDPERRRMLASINSQAFRAHEMIADLMLFSRPPKLAPKPLNVVELVDRILEEFKSDADAQETSIVRRSKRDPVLAMADDVQLGVAISAVLRNALEALGNGGHIHVDIRLETDKAGETWAKVAVADDGPGIDAEVRRFLFDPFYSGREAGRGLGFGLSKCWRIVTDHGGHVDVQSQPGAGAILILSLPASPNRQHEIPKTTYPKTT